MMIARHEESGTLFVADQISASEEGAFEVLADELSRLSDAEIVGRLCSRSQEKLKEATEKSFLNSNFIIAMGAGGFLGGATFAIIKFIVTAANSLPQ